MILKITELRRRLNFKRVTRWLAENPYVEITHDGDAVFEVHPPGTGKTLKIWDDTFGEVYSHDPGTPFELRPDLSFRPVAEPEAANDETDA